MEHLKEKYYGGHDAAAEAFEELCAMVENINVSTTVRTRVHIRYFKKIENWLTYFWCSLFFSK